MLMTVLVLSGTILVATTIAGLLMLYQIRQSVNVSQSAQAIFAADAGLEWELYRHYRDPVYQRPSLTNGADFTTTLIPDGITSLANVSVKSVGKAGATGQTARAFQLLFSAFPATTPPTP